MIWKFEKAKNEIPSDPLVRQLTVEQLKEDLAEFQGLLDSRVNESQLHDFLASHSYFFNNFLRLFGASPLYSKVKLGHEYEVDFAWFDSGSLGPEWSLVEIEAPNRSMFTKSGDPSFALTHAIRQVSDWHTWIHENLPYARKLMPHIEYPLAYIFIGRRDELTTNTRKRLKRICYEHRQFLKIFTLDRLAVNGASVENLLTRTNSRGWVLPMHAFSHSQLANSEPAWAREYLDDPRIEEQAKIYAKAQVEFREIPFILGDEFVNEEWAEPS